MNKQVQYSNKMNVTNSTQRSAKSCMLEQRCLQYQFTQHTLEGNDYVNKLVFRVNK